MATFPTFNLPTNLKTNFGSIYYERRIPVIEYGKKIYYLGGGKLNAIIPIACTLLSKTNESSGELYLIVKTPTTSENVLMPWDIWRKFFASVDDYYAYTEGHEDRELKFRWRNFTDILERKGYGIKESGCWYRNISGYYGKKGRSDIMETSIDIEKCWFDNEGDHIVLKFDGEHFLTKEEAYRATRVDTIVDFDDTEIATPRTFKVKVTLEVTATSEDLARIRANEIISNIQ